MSAPLSGATSSGTPGGSSALFTKNAMDSQGDQMAPSLARARAQATAFSSSSTPASARSHRAAPSSSALIIPLVQDPAQVASAAASNAYWTVAPSASVAPPTVRIGVRLPTTPSSSGSIQASPVGAASDPDTWKDTEGVQSPARPCSSVARARSQPQASSVIAASRVHSTSPPEPVRAGDSESSCVSSASDQTCMA